MVYAMYLLLSDLYQIYIGLYVLLTVCLKNYFIVFIVLATSDDAAQHSKVLL